MIRALWTASTGMKAQMTNLDVIANNLANASTTSFKKSRADFQDLLYQTLRSAGESTGPTSMHPVGEQVGVGSKLAAITKNFSPGSLTRTDRELDVAIAGSGFIPITSPDGETSYTRDGSFKVDGDGNVVTADGYKVNNLGTIPSTAKSVSFAPTGEVSYMDSSGTETSIGTLQLAMFTNPSGLEAVGRNLFKPTPVSGDASLVTPGQSSSGEIQQRFLELSNVNIVEEMVNLISAQRAYEINSKMIRASDEVLATANQITR